MRPARLLLRLLVVLSVAAAGLLAGGGPASAAGPRWTPEPGTTWQWQLSGRVDTSVPAAVYDVDGLDTPARVVRDLHARGRHVVCYLSAGTVEAWRADAGAFPSSVKGRPVDGWAGERWLDVRRLDAVLPVLARRMDVCAAKGFDAVEPDNVDGWSQRTGFPLSRADSLAFARAVARLAHERGMSVALKNDLEQAAALEPSFDFAVNEQCHAYRECAAYAPFVRAGKAVLNAEYGLRPASFCSTAGLSSLGKRLSLGAWSERCP